MGIDARQSRKNKNDRFKYYSGMFVENKTLKKDAICKGVFYAENGESLKTQTKKIGNILVKETIGTIITNDCVNDLEIHDYVEYGDGLFLVTAIVEDELNQQFTARKLVTTTITIRR